MLTRWNILYGKGSVRKSSRDISAPAEGSGPAAESGEGLSDAEIAMLELIEFGIDRWSSASSRRAVAGLAARGLVHVDAEGRHFLTAEGSSVLQAAKGLADAETDEIELSIRRTDEAEDAGIPPPRRR
jgi:hypothetical protein